MFTILYFFFGCFFVAILYIYIYMCYMLHEVAVLFRDVFSPGSPPTMFFSDPR